MLTNPLFHTNSIFVTSCFFTTLISAHKKLELDHIISGKNEEFATELTAPWKLAYKCGIYLLSLPLIST